jgi:hypothetical protein
MTVFPKAWLAGPVEHFLRKVAVVGSETIGDDVSPDRFSYKLIVKMVRVVSDNLF